MQSLKHICIRFFTYMALFTGAELSAQNLVPNPSFEFFKKNPLSHSEFDGNVESWSAPTSGTTDLFTTPEKKTKKSLASVPANFAGYQNPKTGRSYAGFCAYSSSSPQYREYLQVELMNKLEKGELYCITFFLSLSNYSMYSVDKIGITFSKKKIQRETNNYLKGPMATNLDPFIIDTAKWFLYRSLFVSRGGEQYMTIGTFKNIQATPFSNKIKIPAEYKVLDNYSYSYYYIDDVSLMKVQDGQECGCQSSSDTINNIQNETQVVYLTDVDTVQLNRAYILNKLYFEVNKSIIAIESHSELAKLVAILKEHSTYKIRISGHTDNTGDEQANLALSENRSKAVAEYLMANGVQGERIECIGFGSSRPIDTNTTEFGRSKNRRVEFILIENP